MRVRSRAGCRFTGAAGCCGWGGRGGVRRARHRIKTSAVQSACEWRTRNILNGCATSAATRPQQAAATAKRQQAAAVQNGGTAARGGEAVMASLRLARPHAGDVVGILAEGELIVVGLRVEVRGVHE